MEKAINSTNKFSEILSQEEMEKYEEIIVNLKKLSDNVNLFDNFSLI